MFGFSWASIYEYNTNAQLFLKSSWNPVTIPLGEYFIGNPFTSVGASNHIIKKYCIRLIVIWAGRQDYGNMLIILLLCSLKLYLSSTPLPYALVLLQCWLLSPPTCLPLYQTPYPSLLCVWQNLLFHIILCEGEVGEKGVNIQGKRRKK